MWIFSGTLEIDAGFGGCSDSVGRDRPRNRGLQGDSRAVSRTGSRDRLGWANLCDSGAVRPLASVRGNDLQGLGSTTSGTSRPHPRSWAGAVGLEPWSPCSYRRLARCPGPRRRLGSPTLARERCRCCASVRGRGSQRCRGSSSRSSKDGSLGRPEGTTINRSRCRGGLAR